MSIDHTVGKLKKTYVSEIDQFLSELEKKFKTKSHSRRQEEEKYKRIFNLRDNKITKDS